MLHPPVLDYSNCICWGQGMKLLIVHFSPVSYFFPIFSAPCCHTSLICVVPLMLETKYHTHWKL
jgi:hypothetical protein